MDLKEINVTFSGSIGEVNGTGLDLLTYLREVTLSDLNGLIGLETGIDEGEFTDSGEEIEYSFASDYEEDTYERKPLEEIADLPETSDDEGNTPSDVSNILDTELGNKIEKFASVIKYFDTKVATNGITSDTDVIENMINEFKLLDGLYNYYGEFTYSTNFSIV